MDTGLENKTVFVTGGAAGLGKEIARAFFHERARVVIVSRSTKRLVATAKELGEIVCLRGDIGRDGSKIIGRLDRLDVLVNDAGPLKLSRAVLPLLRRSGGSILNVAGPRCKAALVKFTRILSGEAAPRVRVNALCLGPRVRPEEGAGLAVFLSAAQASWITGAVLIAEGGVLRAI